MKKIKVYIIFSLILSVIIIIFIYVGNRNNRIITIEDTGRPDSATYNITSRADIKKIDTIINSMKSLDIENTDETSRVGGFLAFISEYKEDNLILYRIRIDVVTKYVYKGNKESLISKTYYQLDDEHFQMLRDMIADKKVEKNKR